MTEEKQTIEYRVFGSPGTGKTTYLTTQIQNAAKTCGEERLLVASFTRAAAYEIAGRNQNIQNVGTLHALGYRALGGRHKIAETMIDEWNKENPTYKLSGGKQADLDEVNEMGTIRTEGDALFNEMNLNRALMIPKERWKTATRAFETKWDRWKRVHEIIDYTDMIEIPYREISRPPGNPRIGFFDEAQDFTPLELALVRKWGKALDYIVLAGDDDQCIYEWAGARPDVLIEGTPAKKVVLDQSYRVPRTIYNVAMQEIVKVSKREQKEYSPRAAEGEVRHLTGVNSKTPEMIIRDFEKRYPEKRIMILASCSYMLQPLIHALRRAGIPFHNPYRTKNGAWNPLKRSTKDQISTLDRLLAYVSQVPAEHEEEDALPFAPNYIDASEFLKWYEIIKAAGNIPRSLKNKIIEDLRRWIDGGGSMLPAEDVRAFFEEDCGIWDYWGNPGRVNEAIEWFVKNIPSDKARVLEFPQTIIQKKGVQALKAPPQVIVGTIHSVKGGEADVVYVIPDISYNAYAGKINSRAGHDAVIRLKYVAYTRARESLVLLDSASSMTM